MTLCLMSTDGDVLDEIWDLIESVSEGFLTYSIILHCNMKCSTVSLAALHR